MRAHREERSGRARERAQPRGETEVMSMDDVRLMPAQQLQHRVGAVVVHDLEGLVTSIGEVRRLQRHDGDRKATLYPVDLRPDVGLGYLRVLPHEQQHAPHDPPVLGAHDHLYQAASVSACQTRRRRRRISIALTSSEPPTAIATMPAKTPGESAKWKDCIISAPRPSPPICISASTATMSEIGSATWRPGMICGKAAGNAISQSSLRSPVPRLTGPPQSRHSPSTKRPCGRGIKSGPQTVVSQRGRRPPERRPS